MSNYIEPTGGSTEGDKTIQAHLRQACEHKIALHVEAAIDVVDTEPARAESLVYEAGKEAWEFNLQAPEKLASYPVLSAAFTRGFGSVEQQYRSQRGVQGNVETFNGRFAAGDWVHLFEVGGCETHCRVVIDCEKGELVVASERVGAMHFQEIRGARFRDLAESVIAANEAHKDPEQYGLMRRVLMPTWAAALLLERSQKAGNETISAAKSRQMMKSITLVLDASGASDLDESPTYAALDIDQAFISRIEKLLAVCRANELTEARFSYCPNWGPAGIEEDLRLQCGELVVLQGGSFWFTDSPRDSDGSIQTNAETLDRLNQAFASAENGAVVFLTQSMGARDDYEEDHAKEDSQRYDRPSP